MPPTQCLRFGARRLTDRKDSASPRNSTIIRQMAKSDRFGALGSPVRGLQEFPDRARRLGECRRAARPARHPFSAGRRRGFSSPSSASSPQRPRAA